jgi:hypothetical protein
MEVPLGVNPEQGVVEGLIDEKGGLHGHWQILRKDFAS